MRWVTIGSLGASVALGLGALVVAKVMLPAATHSRAQAAPVLVSPMADAASVVVAAGDIPFGHRLVAADLKIVKIPRSAAPETAFSTVEQVLAQDHGGAPVVLTPLAAREPVLPAKLSGPGARPSVSAEIAPGMRAYAIAVTEVSGVGGHALPGDRVDVVLMRQSESDPTHQSAHSEVVIQDVRLLGVGLNADPTSDKPETAATATLEVSVRDAQKLAIAAQLGTLSLALRGAGQSGVEATTSLAASDVGASGVRGAGPARWRPRAAPASSHILIVEGDGGKPKS